MSYYVIHLVRVKVIKSSRSVHIKVYIWYPWTPWTWNIIPLAEVDVSHFCWQVVFQLLAFYSLNLAIWWSCGCPVKGTKGCYFQYVMYGFNWIYIFSLWCCSLFFLISTKEDTCHMYRIWTYCNICIYDMTACVCVCVCVCVRAHTVCIVWPFLHMHDCIYIYIYVCVSSIICQLQIHRVPFNLAWGTSAPPRMTGS